MTLSTGILYVAFGAEYDKLAAKAVSYSRQFTRQPICVLTNIRQEHRSKEWPDDVTFKYFDLPQGENRSIKTSMVYYTPFDKTLYLDCDTIITRSGLGLLMRKASLIERGKLALCACKYRTKRDTRVIYDEHLKITGAHYPIMDFYGAIIGFTRSETEFFNTWHNYWKMTGSGREMPALACAVQNTQQPVNLFPSSTFAYQPDDHALIQHEYKDWLQKKLHCEDFEYFKPFDKTKKHDWAVSKQG